MRSLSVVRPDLTRARARIWPWNKPTPRPCPPFARYSAVDGAAIEDVAKKALDPEALTVVHVLPEEAT